MSERSGLRAFWDVVTALLIREMKTRFGNRHLGLFWIILEPLLHALPIYLIRMLFAQKVEDTFLFLLTGLVPVLYFNKAIGSSLNSIGANINLFSFGVVKLFDVIFARSVLEFGIFLASCAFFLLIFFLLYGVLPDFKCLLCTMGQLFLLFLFTLILSIIFSILCKAYGFLGVFVGYFTRVIYFTSGGFFALSELPANFREYVLYNPVAHIIDFIRGGVLEDYTKSETSLIYPAFWVLFVGAISCFIYRKYREKIFLHV